MTAADYPEHLKLLAVVVDKSQAIGEFVEWLADVKDIHLCFVDDGQEYWPVPTSITRLLAEFFEIDLDKIDDEKRAMLAELRGAT